MRHKISPIIEALRAAGITEVRLLRDAYAPSTPFLLCSPETYDKLLKGIEKRRKKK